MSRFPILGNGVFSLHGCKKLLCHHQKLLFKFIISLKLKNLLFTGAGSFCNIFKKYQYGSLTPDLRKKTPPRKPYCICIFNHCCLFVLQI